MAEGDAQRDRVRQACTVVFDELPPLDAARLELVLRQIVGPCTVEWATPSGHSLPMTAGVVRFGDHRIAMIALGAPVKPQVLARMVAVSPMPAEQREILMGHRAAIRLLYVGDADAPVEQLTALYEVAWALLVDGGLGVLNERAALAQPMELLAEHLLQLGGDPPPLQLWVGVVTYQRDDTGPLERYMARTYGMEQFGLPELALDINDMSAADDAYYMLLNVGLYIIESNSRVPVVAGHTAEFLGHTYLFTEPGKPDDPKFASPTGLLLLVDV